ncbi:MAG: fasciclin domain-containing protein [Leptolyngbya sp. LCM1.Bin17]|nr:MAG: fasciclin domain-containing protein [Leptolyngbya sp. LCM1.Bin17]
MALGLILFGAAPVAMATLPQSAMADMHTAPEVEQPMEAASEPEPGYENLTAAEAAPSIAEIAASSEDFSILTAAIEAAGLTEVLSNSDASLTVFAPTDTAFEALPDGTVDALLLPENQDQLTQLLTYHVVEGEVFSTDLASGDVDTLAGASITVMVDGEAVTINHANVIAADIEASNGVIHVIDAVLLPM